MLLKFLKLTIFSLIITNSCYSKDYKVLDFGAKGDGIINDTKAVQAAIDECTQNGGGKVVIPSGTTVMVGTIFLKNYVTLYIENGGVLLGSPDIADYSDNTYKTMYKEESVMDKCLIFADGVKSISLEGNGTIDGNGYEKNFNDSTGRPMLIRFLNCSDIKIRDLKIINPAAWTSAWLYCNEISIEGVRIHSRVNGNGDGFDFDGCTNVRVVNCSFDTSDDSICLQTSRPDRPCRNITISNCIFESQWAGIRIGLLSRGDFELIAVTNCSFKNIRDAGLKIQMNEGGEMKNMVFSNLVMKNVPRPVFMTFCQQRACVDSPKEMYPMKSMHNFIFSHIIIDNQELDKNSAIFISGLPGHAIENIMFTDIQMKVSGGGTPADAAKTDVKEFTLDILKNWWPEFFLVGTLPASGFFVRHVDNISLQNVQFELISEDARPLAIFNDVENAHTDRIFRNGSKVKMRKHMIK